MKHAKVIPIGVGTPGEPELCPRCLHATLITFPIVALLDTGVLQTGVITACHECDCIRQLVAEHVEHLKTCARQDRDRRRR